MRILRKLQEQTKKALRAELQHVDALAVSDFTLLECCTVWSNQELSVQAGFITEKGCRPS